MRWYAKLTLGKKILAGFLVVACVAGLSGIFSTGVIWEITRRANLMYSTNLTPIRELTDVVKGYQTSLTLLRDITLDLSPQEQNEHRQQLKQTDEMVVKSLDAFMRSNHSPEVAALYQQIGEDLKLYNFFRDKIVDRSVSGQREEAINIMRNQATDVTDRISTTIAKIMTFNDAQAAQHYENNRVAARTALIMNICCLLLGVTTALGLGWLLATSITHPLRNLTGTVASIAAGDLTVLANNDWPADSHNEVHILSRNIDQMTTTLHGIISRITDDSQQLAGSSGKLTSTTESMALRAESAAIRINAVATSSEEMNQTASEIARNCATAASNVSLATTGVTQSQQSMGVTINSIQRIGEHVRETAKLISELGDKSLQINTITATIDDIADQTNLLALNAAIEAARAGDHGRGFAVVADEVRALAARTSTATGEISAMIQTIQAATQHAISAMNLGVAEVEQGTTMVTDTGTALQEIVETIQAISVEVAQIATAAEEQSASIEGIATHIQEVTAIIHENATSTQEFSTEAAGLNDMAGDLQTIIAKFRLVPSVAHPPLVERSEEHHYLIPAVAQTMA